MLEQVDDRIDVDLRRVQQHLAQGGGFTVLGREALDAPSFDHGIEGRCGAQISTDVFHDAAHEAVAVGVDAGGRQTDEHVAGLHVFTGDGLVTAHVAKGGAREVNFRDDAGQARRFPPARVTRARRHASARLAPMAACTSDQVWAPRCSPRRPWVRPPRTTGR